MDEHDDDLTSEVHEGADEETQSFPDTRDELDDSDEDADEEETRDDTEEPLDDDQSELRLNR